MNDNKRKNFVKTNDEYTAEYLRNAGFVELPKEGGKWVFLNCIGEANFSETDNLKMNYTDILTI